MIPLLQLRAVVAYDGTDFLGFQWQPRVRTVQGVLEEALGRLTQTVTRVVGSGRTDAGVHAQGQVVGFQVTWRHSLHELHRALNAVLPGDVSVMELNLAEPQWHPRFSALHRHYRYTILNQPIRSPIGRRFAHHVTQVLDVGALQIAANCLLGVHDFASFGRPTHGNSTVRHIHRAEWLRDGLVVVFDIVGNAFLRGMVRTVVGSLLCVGVGIWETDRLQLVLAQRDRSLAAPPAPACGLCLVDVDYG